jgi:thiamine biosynthesis lipoprotein
VTVLRLARHAMNTRFEFVLRGEREPALRAAGEEALDEITRLETQLSLYRRDSELNQINARAAREPVRVSPPLFHLLARARHLWAATDGAFDPTIAPLMRAWRFVRDTGARPDPAGLAAARACVGMQHVELDAANFTVRFARPGVVLDPGAIGKGWALERAGAILREAGVTDALLHGGTSTVLALGTDADGAPWRVGIEHPAHAPEPAAGEMAIPPASMKIKGLTPGGAPAPATRPPRRCSPSCPCARRRCPSPPCGARPSRPTAGCTAM